MENYWMTIVIFCAANLLTLAFLWLIPTNEQVHEQELKVRNSIKYGHKKMQSSDEESVALLQDQERE